MSMAKLNLSDLRDDKTVLLNPHKGWYWHYIDNGMKSGLYRDQDKTGDECKSFPGLNHLYLRIDWTDIQPAKDVFNWSEIDRIMEEWGRKGYRFSFRVCAAETNVKMCFAAPKWLYDLGCGGKFFPPDPKENPSWWEPFDDNRYGGKNNPDAYYKWWEPDYGDPLFLTYLEKFLENFAKKFDNDPRVEFVDIGSYGVWGEGHTYLGSRKSWSLDVLKKHAFLHAKYFKNKTIMVNDDFIIKMRGCTQKERDELRDYCYFLGMGIRDDSIIAGNFKERCYHSVEAPSLFDLFYKQAPVDLELGHYSQIAKEDYKDGFVFLDAMKRCHATFAGFHGYPDLFLKENKYFAEYAANRLGYWYFLNGICHESEVYCGTGTCIDFEWENAGFGLCYVKYDLEIMLSCQRDGNNYALRLDEFDNRHFKPGEITCERYYLSVGESIGEGKYDISIRISEKGKPIKIGLKAQCVRDDGFYRISELVVKKYD